MRIGRSRTLWSYSLPKFDINSEAIRELESVFRTNPEAPVLCAMEISKALKSILSSPRGWAFTGPVNEITDLNEHANIPGAGINIAQRVMDCGDAGQQSDPTAATR